MNCYVLPSGMLATLFLLCSAVAAADEIYKWVTPDGVTHYSETTPGAVLASVEIIELEVAEPVKMAPRDYRSMLEVAESIEAGRLARERLRLEKRRLQSRQGPRDISADDYDWSSARKHYPYYPVYLRPPDYRHLRDKPREHTTPAPEKRSRPLTRIAPP